MLPLLIGALAGGAMGAGKYGLGKAQADRQRKVQAATTAYSPWTRMKAEAPEEPNLAGDLLSGVASGAAMGQGFQKHSSDLGLQDAMKSRMEAETAQMAELPSISAAPGGMTGAPGFWSRAKANSSDLPDWYLELMRSS